MVANRYCALVQCLCVCGNLDESLPPVQAQWRDEVFILTHEKAKPKLLSDYFSKKFHPLAPVMVIGRSFAADPITKQKATLWDCWKETV